LSRSVGKHKALIPPLLKLDCPLLSSSGSLNRSGGGGDNRLSLLSNGGVGGLGALLSGGGLGNGLSLGLSLGGSGLLGLGLHGLAGLTEKATELVALGLCLGLSCLSVRLTTLLLAEVGEEGGTALVLGGSSGRLGDRGLRSSLLGSLNLGSSSHALRLNGLGSFLDRVVELRSGAGNRSGLSGSSSFLLSLLMGGAGDLLEEVAEDGAALGLGGGGGFSLLLLLLLLLFLSLNRSSGSRSLSSRGLDNRGGLSGRSLGGGSFSSRLGLIGLGLFLLLLLLLLNLLLLSEEGPEDGSPLAGAGAALGVLVLGLLSRSSSGGSGSFLVLLGFLVLSLLLGLSSLLGGLNNNRLGQLLELSLVGLARGDGLLLGLGLGGLGLEGGDPAVTLGGAGGLESVLVAAQLEVELVGAILGDVRDVRLFSC
jgi:hypothetical protein